MAGALNKRQKEARNRLVGIKPGASAAELRDSILKLCVDNNYDPIAELIDMAEGRNLRLVEELQTMASDLDKLGEDDPIDTAEIARRLRLVAEAIPRLTPADEIAIHKEVASYISSKVKSLDIQQTVNQNVTVTIKQFNIVATAGAIEANKVKVVTPVTETPKLGTTSG